MRRLDRSNEDGAQLSPEERQRVTRAAFLRPWGLLVVLIGAVFFALTLAWWLIPLTLATYAALVFLAIRDPLFQRRVLEGRRESRPETQPESPKEVSPERRARWLPRGETRQKVEAALGIYRRTVFAIQESDDVTRAVLDDAIPKLEGVVERLVDVAERREKLAGAIRDLKTSDRVEHRENQRAGIEELENELRSADAQVSDTFEKLLTLRAQVVRVSVESGGAVQDAAAKLNADLDTLNLRLEALRSTMSPPEHPDQ